MIRRLVALSTAALALLAAPAGAAVTEAPPVDPAAQRLAEKYVPITMLREQRDPPCDKKEEQYQPTSVETVLGNPTVTLTHEEPDGRLVDVEKAPTAADIAGLRDGYYLDYEGKVLGDTCVYARAFRQLVAEGKAPAITYAHVAREPNHDGFALQFWFYWYFNQFNDLHEGDWEGMQITFESNTTAGALEEEPSEVIVFQHAGGERADWEDGKVQKQGTHPVVYPAAGSHATFYDSAVYLGNGQNGSGVGCDNTSEPLRELRLRPVLLPETAPERGAFQWLSYRGRWGEREKGYNNGPTGPVTKTVWREPFAWMEGQRSTSPRLPGGSVVGGPVTGAFCGAVVAATDLTHLATKSRAAAIGVVAGIVLALVLLFGLTRWGPIDLTQLRTRRAFGQILRTARRLYRHHWWPLIPIGLIAFPIVGGVKLLGEAVANGRGVDDTAGRAGVHLAFADLLETLGPPVAYTLVAAIVIVFVRELARGHRAGVRDSVRGMLARFWRVVAAQLMVTFALLLLLLTVVGIPIAAWKYVSWLFVQQEVLFTDKSIREAFRGSSALVRGRWWHTVRVAGVLWLLSVAAGPLLGFALIFTGFDLVWINLLGSVVFALFIPYVAVGQTLLYFDLQVRAEEEPVQKRRLLRRLRPSPATS
ncbi:MAG: hypothetical protein E6G51_02465 [Actinobacteria bacterium]|nr:MAG: hypothetical protein E6G51_02465 [Actinomycetota bacterium]